jgi:uncharacterized membrane protein YfcA
MEKKQVSIPLLITGVIIALSGIYLSKAFPDSGIVSIIQVVCLIVGALLCLKSR